MARGWHWLVAVAAGVLVPKCLLCLLGYAGLAASLGWAGPELCGGAQPNNHQALLAFIAVGLAVAAVCDRRVRKGRRS